MKTKALSEHDLISGLKAGSARAFALIYERYAWRIYHFVRRYTKVTADAEEIVEDVFIKLWSNRNIIRQEDTLQGFLFTIAKHNILNCLRRQINSLQYADYLEYREVLADHGSLDIVDYEEFLNLVKAKISMLNATQRKVIMLSRFEMKSNKEIAQQLHLSEQTVKNQLSLGLKALRKALQQYTD